MNASTIDTKLKNHNLAIKIFWYVFILYTLFTLGTMLFQPQKFAIPLQVDSIKSGTWKESLNESYTIEVSKGILNVQVDAENMPQVFYYHSFLYLSFLAAVGFIIFQAKILTQSITDNKHFSKNNIHRLTRIGLTLVIIGILYPVLEGYIIKMAADKVSIPNIEFDYRRNFDWPLYFIGLLITILSKAFERGFELQEENTLTI